MSGVQIDTISARGGSLAGSGQVAQRLLEANFNVNALRTNTVLRKDEWEQMDNTLVEIARKRLVATQALMNAGLRHNISNGLGTTILEWEQVTDMEPAEVSMSGVTEGERDRLEFALQGLPLPIIHKDFQINIRALEASRRTGDSLDTAQTAMASRLVVEAIEEMVFVGNATQAATRTIPGLLTHADRNTGSVTGDWDTSTTGEQMVDDIIAMQTALQADFMFGPYGLFVPNAAYLRMADDFKTNSDKTILQRLLDIPNISWILPSSDVTAGSIVMLQLTKDVFDEVVGMQPTVIEWETNGGMTFNFKVMAIMIPRVRSTITNQSGVCHYS